jgi:ribosomal protein S9
MAPQTPEPDVFCASRDRFEAVVGYLRGPDALRLEHAELEARLAADMREVIRQLYQDHLDLRAKNEERLCDVVAAGGTPYRAVEADHERPLSTVFGSVTVRRLAYRHRGEENLYPADAALNLPEEVHSHGLRKLSAIESTRGSFGEAKEAIRRASGVEVGKRQVEQLAQRSAVDFEDFYEAAEHQALDEGDVLVLSCDGKGIVMRPDALRAGTAKAATEAKTKLKTRLSKGEKSARKRMAEVAAVYDVTPVIRVPGDVIGRDDDAQRPEAPKAKNKWLTASVVNDAAEVIGAAFDEACRRDPAHERTWIALVDGARHQIDRIKAEAKARDVDVTIVCDFVHVMEYLWSSAWWFFDEGDPAAEAWVADKALGVLRGEAATVAASIRRKATCLDLAPDKRKNADTCADYLLAKKEYLCYERALGQGWPIGTGVIEGAVRHLVKDRLDLTGSRWGLNGAEAILKLRALRSNGDFENYWKFHLGRERHRVHETRYVNGAMPRAA